MASGILGSSDLSANSDTTVYTVPADTYSVVTVNFCNRGSNTANIRLATATRDTPGGNEYLEYDVSDPNGVQKEQVLLLTQQRKLL